MIFERVARSWKNTVDSGTQYSVVLYYINTENINSTEHEQHTNSIQETINSEILNSGYYIHVLRDTPWYHGFTANKHSTIWIKESDFIRSILSFWSRFKEFYLNHSLLATERWASKSPTNQKVRDESKKRIASKWK